MKHQQYNPGFAFVREPGEFNKFTEREVLQYCLGATLYMPGTREVVDKILNRGLAELASMVMCFEDAIMEEELGVAESNVLQHLKRLSDALEQGRITHDEIPLTFLRVRTTEQFRRFAEKLTPELAAVLSGFVFPKFYSYNASEYLGLLEQLNRALGHRLYGMPILEGHAIAMVETRMQELIGLRDILKPYKELILNIRVGGTDFSSLFGVRRGINYSIYDILTVRDCISDILNVFGRVEEDYVVSGPVWEYFLAHKKDDLSRLLEQNIHRSLMSRNPILNDAIDGLLREVMLDRANGFIGKTIIHPSHARFVNAMQAATREEYEDALQILEGAGGVVKSSRANKMNERNPHRSWAKRIVSTAHVYGVVENEASYIELIRA
ncbi:MAG: HpcH/HpaI aldolase/citrate lyase family protein [Bacteroidales bacterium]|nr:HpcH/HpaI aldolase/citrate lyase family protein [Bacteroidales bacterium]